MKGHQLAFDSAYCTQTTMQAHTDHSNTLFESVGLIPATLKDRKIRVVLGLVCAYVGAMELANRVNGQLTCLL